jgi:hypothetical protein
LGRPGLSGKVGMDVVVCRATPEDTSDDSAPDKVDIY